MRLILIKYSSSKGINVMFFLSFSWCAETLCEEVVHLLVEDMLVCATIGEVEDTDRTPPEQISWCKVVHVPNRPVTKDQTWELSGDILMKWSSSHSQYKICFQITCYAISVI
jgi:hypothetical protein